MEYEAVIGLEVHAELETKSKMFCACPVVDVTRAEPNLAVCPVCAGMPGTLPVVNARAVEFGIRVALALNCEIQLTSIFARKNYFYPDLPKGYQISQYEKPLARSGHMPIFTSQGEKIILIRRVHMEEDTGKLTHVVKLGNGEQEREHYSLIDLNRAGIPLLEIVTEPDFRKAEEVKAYASGLRALLRYLGVNSGDMQKGVLRIEPNVSVRPIGSTELGNRVEVKNLNSFRALERSVDYEISRQVRSLKVGIPVRQETVGWDEIRGETFTQRVKEGEEDYRYFPEPDLPPIMLQPEYVENIRQSLPELPQIKYRRFIDQYGLNDYDAGVLISEKKTAEYFEKSVQAAPDVPPKTLSNWITGELFGLLHQAGSTIDEGRILPGPLGDLARMVMQGRLNRSTARAVLTEMFHTGKQPEEIAESAGLEQISDRPAIQTLVRETLESNPVQVQEYLQGKEAVLQWFFGQVMRAAGGKANPQLIQAELNRQMAERRLENG
jgi:aspartyl-tRNA(Asn)/glutamyl-tRNA(Gln) amidotransferase subunit B